jgi:hypothetical protein
VVKLIKTPYIMDDIVKNNMLIAEFLGYKNTSPNNSSFNFYEKEGAKIIEAMSMNYNKSFDCLMPVIEKIENIIESNHIFCAHAYRIGMSSFNIRIEKDRRFYEFEAYFIEYESKLSAFYSVVIQFIKWYNKHK